MKRDIIRDGKVIRAECPAGHVFIAPNKGLGRANVAAWETRHQDCQPKAKRAGR